MKYNLILSSLDASIFFDYFPTSSYSRNWSAFDA
jgi:hypothetical protein